jgi:hypothetical protein
MCGSRGLSQAQRKTGGAQRGTVSKQTYMRARRDADNQIVYTTIKDVAAVENTASASDAKLRIFHSKTANYDESEICEVQRRACKDFASSGVAFFRSLHHNWNKACKNCGGASGDVLNEFIPIAALCGGQNHFSERSCEAGEIACATGSGDSAAADVMSAAGITDPDAISARACKFTFEIPAKSN